MSNLFVKQTVAFQLKCIFSWHTLISIRRGDAAMLDMMPVCFCSSVVENVFRFRVLHFKHNVRKNTKVSSSNLVSEALVLQIDLATLYRVW